MTFFELVLVATSLALDAAIVAVGAGAMGTLRARTALTIALLFGAFQAFMPLLGYLLGLGFSDYVSSYGPVIGFVLLMLVGLKMAYESFQEEDEARERDIAHAGTLLALALATSIDAFAVGVSFPFIELDIALALATIGLVTFALALAGAYAGGKGRHLLGNRIELVGAAVLVLLAFKVLLGL